MIAPSLSHSIYLAALAQLREPPSRDAVAAHLGEMIAARRPTPQSATAAILERQYLASLRDSHR